MLVLTRKHGERMLIDGKIEVRVVRIGGNRVRLAIEAPKGVKIIRGELVGQEPPSGQAMPAEPDTPATATAAADEAA